MTELPRGRLADASPKLTLVIVCTAVVLASLDLFIVNVALPEIAKDFGETGLGNLSWVLNAYAIVYAALLVLLGRISDRYRREYGFLLGVAIFTVASALCATASSVEMLVAFRILQAVGAALLTPTSLSLVLASFEPERRAGAVRAWAAVGGAAAAIGPVVGGLLVALSWRWVFIVNVPIGLVALAIGWRRLRVVEGQDVPRPDVLGAALVTGGVGALTLGLVEGGDWGWGSPSTVSVLALAVAVLGLFALHCARHSNPLIDRVLFHSRAFNGAGLVALFFSVAFGAMLLSGVLWDQNVWGWSALQTGLAIAPGPAMVPLFAFLVAGKLIERIGAGLTMVAGTVIFAIGILWWALSVGLEPNYVGDMLGGMIVTGIGVGLTLPTMMATATSDLPPTSFATGSAVVNMLRQVGLAIGVAVLIAVLGSPTSPEDSLDAFRRGWLVIAAFSLLAGAISFVALARRGAGPERAAASASRA